MSAACRGPKPLLAIMRDKAEGRERRCRRCSRNARASGRRSRAAAGGHRHRPGQRRRVLQAQLCDLCRRAADRLRRQGRAQARGGPRRVPQLRRAPGQDRRGDPVGLRQPAAKDRSRSRTPHRSTTDLANLAAAVDAARPARAFMNAASPGVVAIFQPNEYYPSEDAYLEARRRSAAARVRSNRRSRLPAADRQPRPRHGPPPRFRRPERRGIPRVVDRNVAALNHALRNLPADRLRMHMCWGNYPGPHHRDIPLERIAERRAARQAADNLCSKAPIRATRTNGRCSRRCSCPTTRSWCPGVIDSDLELHRAPRTRRPAPVALRRRGRARAGDGRLGLRLFHVHGSADRLARHRLGQARKPGRRRPDCECEAVDLSRGPNHQSANGGGDAAGV